MIVINYRQMLAAKAVYSDTNNDVIDAVYGCCGQNGVVEVYERGMETLIKCNNGNGIFRVYDRESKFIRLEDVLSLIVIGNPKQFVIDKMKDSVLITLIGSTDGELRPLLVSLSAFGLEHLKVGMVASYK